VLPAVIALGSNLGNREDNLRAAVHDIAALGDVVVTAVSGIVQSHAVKPTGTDADAPSYLNAVMLVQSALHPEALLKELNRIEADHGRVRVERWGDRTLDLDIIDFAGLQRDTDDLTLPHPRASERAFVIVPWLQVDPDAEIRGHGRIDSLAVAHSGDAWPLVASALWVHE
jgi:2-amino-4-hydroxy-6-hydroxymethyldihydropteridine diphosphokinase